jgi:Leu/Phe-tRNA-protein transferase
MDKRFLLTYTIKAGGSSFGWFETEEELLWVAKNNSAIIPMEAFEIDNVRNIDLKTE